MSNTNSAVADGKPARKTLASQLDRLDGIIDVLADGLNETVAQVVQQAVTTAVQQALDGLLQAAVANPDLVRTLADRLGPPTPDDPAAPAQGKGSVPPRPAGGVLAAVRRRVGALVEGVRGRLRPVRLPLIVLAVGGIAVAVTFLAGPSLSTAANCLARLVRHVV